MSALEIWLLICLVVFAFSSYRYYSKFKYFERRFWENSQSVLSNRVTALKQEKAALEQAMHALKWEAGKLKRDLSDANAEQLRLARALKSHMVKRK